MKTPRTKSEIEEKLEIVERDAYKLIAVVAQLRNALTKEEVKECKCDQYHFNPECRDRNHKISQREEVELPTPNKIGFIDCKFTRAYITDILDYLQAQNNK